MRNIPLEEAFIFVLFEFVCICVSDNHSHHLLTHFCIQREVSISLVSRGGAGAPLVCKLEMKLLSSFSQMTIF